MKPYVIGIAGLSGSGKSALAYRLKSELSACEVVTLDSYYLPQSHLAPDHELGHNAPRHAAIKAPDAAATQQPHKHHVGMRNA